MKNRKRPDPAPVVDIRDYVRANKPVKTPGYKSKFADQSEPTTLPGPSDKVAVEIVQMLFDASDEAIAACHYLLVNFRD